MALARERHTDLTQVDDEFLNMDRNKMPQVVEGTRAPTSSDRGIEARFWFFNNNGTLQIYARHTILGWTKIF